ncbi:MAG: NTP transferase domain-containing protein [Candidatus Brocadia sinica]|nr:NTP transferase domain-containing protein [Candidatus Brocadia sinica]
MKHGRKIDIQAAILAGGKGTRLRPITYEIPKSMVQVHGKPFLLHLLELLKPFGIKRVLLLTGYLGKEIEKYFGDGSAFGLKIEYSYEETSLGTGGALKNAEDKLGKEFIVLNGDTFLPIDYGELVKYFRESKKIGAVTVYKNIDRIVPNNIIIDTSNIVTAYNKKNPDGMAYVDAGVAVFKKNVLDLIPHGCSCSLEEEIFGKLIEMKELVAFPTEHRFYDMGSFKGLEAAERVLTG